MMDSQLWIVSVFWLALSELDFLPTLCDESKYIFFENLVDPRVIRTYSYPSCV